MKHRPSLGRALLMCGMPSLLHATGCSSATVGHEDVPTVVWNDKHACARDIEDDVTAMAGMDSTHASMWRSALYRLCEAVGNKVITNDEYQQLYQETLERLLPSSVGDMPEGGGGAGGQSAAGTPGAAGVPHGDAVGGSGGTG